MDAILRLVSDTVGNDDFWKYAVPVVALALITLLVAKGDSLMDEDHTVEEQVEEGRIFSALVRKENRQERRARERAEAKETKEKQKEPKARDFETELRRALGSKSGSGKSRTNRRNGR